MDWLSTTVPAMLAGGLRNLAAYLAAHVLLCLLPAFFIAGAMSALIPKESVTRFLGRNTPGAVSYPAAAAAGSLLAVCSCTIVPLFAGIYRKGAGLGPAITFLFFAPAANILALVYTGGVIGVDLALARFVLSLVFGIGIGLIMALLFRADDAAHDRAAGDPFGARGGAMRPPALAFLLVWIALLLAGTLKLGVLTGSFAEFTVPWAGADRWQAALDRLVPFDARRGEEGVTVQGALLIALLAAIGVSAWRGLEHIHDCFSRATRLCLALIAATLLAAALAVEATPAGLRVGLTGKFVGVALGLGVLYRLGRQRLSADELRDWLWESWRFVRQIFPLLVAGVAFGVFMYFPTLVEVPIAQMFLDLGMHRGPLLAYLMADPELSLQSILVIAAIIGRAKAFTYVGLVALFSAVAGLAYGAWIDGAPLAVLLLSLAAFVALLALALALTSRRSAALHGV
jgi:hypothetical protein